MEVALFQLQRLRSRSPERRQLLEIFTHVLYGLDGSDEALVFKCSARIYAEAPELVLRCFVDERGLIGHLNIYHVTATCWRWRRSSRRCWSATASPSSI